MPDRKLSSIISHHIKEHVITEIKEYMLRKVTDKEYGIIYRNRVFKLRAEIKQAIVGEGKKLYIEINPEETESVKLAQEHGNLMIDKFIEKIEGME